MKKYQGICVLTNTIGNIKGNIEFIEDNKETIIKLNISGLTPGNHGFHIHEAGDLTDNCTSACSHFNPTNKKHGGPNDKERHIGDLGNIIPDKNGVVKKILRDKYIKLKGKYSIIGRCVVIHEQEDDLGNGGLDIDGNIVDIKIYNESIKTGNAGKRIACGVIGYSKKMFH
jgi:Cu-Zn family superoxide dismutase|tara:strand:- start:915 stop:1427 length:513 start_codon:yes stop_codon:yes gene_type:complete